MSHNIQLRSRVVGDQDANQVPILVRHRPRTSPWVPFSLCVAHLILISVLLSLAPSDQFRTEPTSLLTTIIRLIVDSTLLCVFDVTLNSSMMFSSLFAVVQSSEPHCSQCHPWAAMTTSASQPRLQLPSLTSCSRTLATLQCTLPVSCLVTRRLFWLSAHSGHELSTSLTYVYTRHLDTGYYRSYSPCDSHLNRHILTATSFVWPVTLAHHTLCISAT